MADIDPKLLYLIQDRPLLPKGHGIMLKMADARGKVFDQVQCLVDYYDPLSGALKLCTEDFAAICLHLDWAQEEAGESAIIEPMEDIRYICLWWDGISSGSVVLHFFNDRPNHYEYDGVLDDGDLLLDQFDEIQKELYESGKEPAFYELTMRYPKTVVQRYEPKYRSYDLTALNL